MHFYNCWSFVKSLEFYELFHFLLLGRETHLILLCFSTSLAHLLHFNCTYTSLVTFTTFCCDIFYISVTFTTFCLWHILHPCDIYYNFVTPSTCVWHHCNLETPGLFAWYHYNYVTSAPSTYVWHILHFVTPLQFCDICYIFVASTSFFETFYIFLTSSTIFMTPLHLFDICNFFVASTSFLWPFFTFLWHLFLFGFTLYMNRQLIHCLKLFKLCNAYYVCDTIYILWYTVTHAVLLWQIVHYLTTIHILLMGYCFFVITIQFVQSFNTFIITQACFFWFEIERFVG